MRAAVLNMIGDLPFVTPGMHRLDADGWTRLETAVIANDEGDRPFAQGIILDLERRLKVTDGDRLRALYGPKVVAGKHTPLDRLKPRKERRKQFLAELRAAPVKPISETAPKPKPQTIKDGEEPTRERFSHGEFRSENVVTLISEHEHGTGERAPKEMVVSRFYRDQLAKVWVRLSRWPDLTDKQKEAGVWLSERWEKAGLQPSMIADLLRTGGGRGGSPADVAIDARTDLHYAIQALNLGGVELTRIVFAVVIEGASATKAGAARYADEKKAAVHVSTALHSGLNLLVSHLKLARSSSSGKAAIARTFVHERAKRRRNPLTGGPPRPHEAPHGPIGASAPRPNS